MSFVHLHVHTQYSLLQGAVRISSLFQRVRELEMPAVAITDSHNLFGAIDFYFAAKSAGVKPIIGCEVHYLPEGAAMGRTPPAPNSGKPKHNHLVLLCKNLQGYQNLCQMITQAYAIGGVDRGLLDRYGDGLVVLSGCIRGEIPYRILQGDESGALESMHWFKKRFGSDFYLELQDTGLPEQSLANETMFALGQRLGISCVATADCHYLHPHESESQEVLQCIEFNRNLDFDRPKSLAPSEFYLKDAQSMRERFERFPGACDATLEIAGKCDVQFRFKDEKGQAIYHLPNYRPDGVGPDDSFDLIEYFRSHTRKGLEARLCEPAFVELKQSKDWPEKEKIYRSRLEGEIEMIIKTGFPGYFLIVADFVNWAKENRIPVGPGRGSGAGSLVAYSLRITDIDPIQFNLLFERFINPERVSLPDFDIDFCQDRRGEVINYVTRKYGADNVCQIITFGKLQTRAVIKDVGRVMGLSFAETDQITKLVPETLNIKIRDAIDQEPRLRELMENDSKVAKIMEYALALEGLYRNAGVHAAGVIITEKPVVTYCPLYIGKDGVAVTQFDKDFAEKIGLVKFDFLGLKTLTVIDNAVELVRVGQRALGFSEAESFSLAKMNYNDPKVYELIGSGDTDGVFQVESSGMKDLCTRLLPNSVEDLTAINALYRPGPLGSGMVDDFIDRKHGRKPIEYELPELESILKDTYGVILYQEQVMQIARELAGYSLGQADMLRRAMGKKKADEMAKHREIFLEGARKKSIPEKKAGAVFDLMAKFAEYGFNKSHSAAYAVLTYQTAYLKAHYPAEFMAALMTTEMSNTDKLAKYISDARAHGLVVLPPDVNVSGQRFGVERDAQGMTRIRFALAAIKGVGSIAVDEIVQSRTQDGPFSSVMDFCRRVSTRKANKKVLESLTAAGAFDTIAEVNRATLYQSLEKMLEHASDEQEERALGQSSLFDSIKGEELKIAAPATAIFQQVEDWPSAKKLANEKQVVGFYVSGHPMDGWQKTCEDWLGWSTRKLRQYVEDQAAKASQASSAPSQAPAPASFSASGKGGYSRPVRKEIRIAGLITELKEITTKKGARMAFAGFEDLFGKVEVIFFPEAFQRVGEQVKQAMAEARPLLLSAEIDQQNADSGDENVKLLAKSMEWLDVAHKDAVQEVVFRLPLERVTVDQLRSLKKHLLQHRGPYPVSIVFTSEARFRTRIRLPVSLRVAGSPQLVSGVSGIFGPELKDVVEMRGSRK